MQIGTVTVQCLQSRYTGLLDLPNKQGCHGDVVSAGKTPSSASAYQVLTTAFPAMHASAYRLLRLLASVCKGALTPLYAGLIAIASSSLQRAASEDSGSFASGSLCSIRSEVRSRSRRLVMEDPSVEHSCSSLHMSIKRVTRNSSICLLAQTRASSRWLSVPVIQSSHLHGQSLQSLTCRSMGTLQTCCSMLAGAP